LKCMYNFSWKSPILFFANIIPPSTPKYQTCWCSDNSLQLY
jgi:hypothetical protein